MRRPDEVEHFRCRRCGIAVTEFGGLCKDCQAVLLSMKEMDQWRSDYSKPQRRAMSRLIRQHGGAVIEQPRRDRANRGYEIPVRDQVQKWAPLEFTDHEEAAS